MLSYQHAYHAANPADLHKHFVLAGLLELLTIKPRPITYMETHAGRGLYDLTSNEARKTGEAALGVERLSALPPGPYGRAIDAVRQTHGPNAYPGSPLLAQHVLRDGDRMCLMELHPAEHTALKGLMGKRADVQKRDGYTGVLALAPPEPRRGLVLVDPSYEIKESYRSTAAFCHKLVKAWQEAVIMVWYPLLPDRRHLAMLDALPDGAMIHEVAFDQKDGRGMKGSGLALINPPYKTTPLLDATIPAMAPVLRNPG